MREIKFRVWCHKNKKFLEDFRYPNGHSGLLLFALTGKLTDVSIDWDDYGTADINYSSFDKDCYDLVLQQFTGLKDKNGEEIYEGDVLEFIGGTCDFLPLNFYGQRYEKGQILKVSKLLSGFTLQRLTNESEIPNVVGNISNYDFWNHQRSFKVIGNIYENPEFLPC